MSEKHPHPNLMDLIATTAGIATVGVVLASERQRRHKLAAKASFLLEGADQPDNDVATRKYQMANIICASLLKQGPAMRDALRDRLQIYYTSEVDHPFSNKMFLQLLPAMWKDDSVDLIDHFKAPSETGRMREHFKASGVAEWAARHPETYVFLGEQMLRMEGLENPSGNS